MGMGSIPVGGFQFVWPTDSLQFGTKAASYLVSYLPPECYIPSNWVAI